MRRVSVHEPARHPPPTRRRDRMTTLAQASLTLQTARSPPPRFAPASRPRTGASLPGTQASPRTGLTPAGRPELVAPTSCGCPFPYGARAVPAHSRIAIARATRTGRLLLVRSDSRRTRPRKAHARRRLTIYHRGREDGRLARARCG